MNPNDEKRGQSPFVRSTQRAVPANGDCPLFSNPELSTLLPAMLDGEMSDAEQARLADLLRDNPQAQQVYLDFCWTHALLRRELGVYGEVPFSAAGFSPPSEVHGNSQLNPEPPFPTLSTTHYPLPTSHFSVGSWAFSYMVATIIMGVAILGFWAYKITHHQHIAEAPSQLAPSKDMPEMVFVGRITGMVDVKWSDDPRYLPPPGFAHVPLGRKYILDSGLLEITYDSGAKVILEGPCTYEVESTAGGYLALGKLTARVGEDKETRRQGGKEKKADAASPHLPVSPSPGLPASPLFSVRTPTAVVTDLGTEFGVEVSEDGNTTSHVFRGSVKVQVVGDGRKEEVILGKNESSRVVNKGHDGPRLVLADVTGNPPKFVRRLVEPPKLLDLLDIIAGGNGTGNRRECGIHPLYGRMDPEFIERSFAVDSQYRRVPWNRLIDGVFVPDGGTGPVQVDSAEHAFDAFPQTDGRTFGCIWSRAAEVDPDRLTDHPVPWVYVFGRGEKFMPKGRGLLCLHPNAGITFDLAEMRRTNPGVTPSKFRTIAGTIDSHQWNSEVENNIADLWILVDGQLRLKREKLRPRDGMVEVEVLLQPSDRFITLAATDGGDGHSCDGVVFGDPVLEMASTESEDSAGNGTERVKQNSPGILENQKED